MAEVKEVQSNFEKSQGELSGLDVEKKRGEITEKLDVNKINKQLEDLKLSAFKSEHNIDENSEIPEDLKKDFDSFELKDEQKKDLYEEYKKDICDVCADRDRRLKSLLGDKEGNTKGEIDELEETIDSEIQERTNSLAEKQAELEQLQLDPEANKDQIEKVNEEIATLNSEIETLNGLKGKVNSELRQPSIKAFGNHNDLRVYAFDTLTDRFGSSLTSPDIEEIAGKRGANTITQRAEEQLKGEPQEKDDLEQNPEKEEGQEKGDKAVQQPKGASIPPEMAAKLAQQMAGQGGAAGQPTSATVVGDNAEQEVDLEPDYLAMLGYNPDNAMNFENSSAILENFANEGLTDKARIEMLNNPECKDVILKALKVTGNNLSPKKSKMFNATRDNILRLAKGPMMEKALQSIGIENPENIKKEFNEANKAYTNRKRELESILNETAISPEDRAKAEKELSDLNEKYKTISNVADFQKSSNQIKTLRTRFISFKDAILSKDSYTQSVKSLKEATDNFMFEKKEDKSPKTTQKEVDDKDFRELTPSERDAKEAKDFNMWSGLVEDRNKVAEKDIANAQNPQSKEEKAKENEGPNL